jgi:hypothetical protein
MTLMAFEVKGVPMIGKRGYEYSDMIIFNKKRHGGIFPCLSKQH